MVKISVDKAGNLRKDVFYRFDVQFDDFPEGEDLTPEWTIVPRTPTDDVLRICGEEPWIYLAEAGDIDTAVEIKNCPTDPNHETLYYYTSFAGEAHGGNRVSPFIPTMNFCCFGLSDNLRQHMEVLKIRGARIDPIDLRVGDTDQKLQGFWALQFIGRNARRIPKVVDGPNACPFCGKTEIICQACGYWNFCCTHCEQHMVIAEYARSGPDDKRVPYERGLHRILEGSRWDGSDLLQGSGRNYASKRFIDWLLRIHAFPFYAEPVWFCVDGMNAQQKRWLDELQKPLEAR